MKEDLQIKDGVIIPGHELEITASRAGGPGGQHVNKSNTRITVRWNVQQTHALTDEQKKRVLEKLEHELTKEGDIIIHHGSSRSQHQNKKTALDLLAEKIKKALQVPKKRMKTRASRTIKEKRLRAKKKRSEVKKTRCKVPMD